MTWIRGPATDDAWRGSILAAGKVDEIAWTPRAFADGRAWRQEAEVLASAEGAAATVVTGLSLPEIDTLFRLRALQLSLGQGQIPGCALILAQPTDGVGAAATSGLGLRMRTGWPFRSALFCGDAAMVETIRREGLAAMDRTAALERGVRRLAAYRSGALPRLGKDQLVAAQVQPLWARCGTSTPEANQLEALLERGAFVIRVFIDSTAGAGVGQQDRLRAVLAQNRIDAAPHLETMACPPPDTLEDSVGSADVAFAALVESRTRCQVADDVAGRLVRRAGVVLVNHAINVDFARHASPQARVVLETQDYLTRGAVERARAGGDAAAFPTRAPIRRHLAIERRLWRAADACTTVSLTECRTVRRHAPDTHFILPRAYARPARDPGRDAAWDMLIVGDQHAFNIQSVAAFLATAVEPSPRLREARIAIAGAVGQVLAPEWRTRLPNVCWLGFVPDLDALRDRTKLSVSPDIGGTGVSIKTLTALAAHHPLAATRFSLRGFPPQAAALFPAAESLPALADDISRLLDDAAALEQRRRLSARVSDLLAGNHGYAAVLGSLPKRRRAAAPWLREVPNDPTLDLRAGGGGGAALGFGWHAAEAHGRWMDGDFAVVRLPAAWFSGGASIGISLVAPGRPIELTVDLEGQRRAATAPADVQTRIEWTFDPIRPWPGHPAVSLTLELDHCVRPADATPAGDARVLGLCIDQIAVKRLI